MPKQDYLIQLIKTLSPAEQRYFKLFSEIQAGEKKYVRLFELLQGKEAYTPKELQKALGITAPQLAVLKHYLTQALLTSLRANVEQPGEIGILYDNLLNVQNLRARRLHAQALEITEKYLQKAWEIECLEVIDDFLKNKWHCLYQLGEYEKLQQLHIEDKRLAAVTAELTEITHLRTLSIWLEKERDLKKGTATINTIRKHPLVKKHPEKLLSLRAQVMWFRIEDECFKVLPSAKFTELDLARREWEFFIKRPHIKEILGMDYVTCYARLIRCEAEAGNREKALALLSELGQLIDTRTVIISRVKASSLKAFIYNWRMIIFQMEGKFEEVLKEVQKALPLIKERNIFEQLEINFSHAVALVHLKQSKAAVEKLDELIQMKLPVRSVFEASFRILIIMAQIDMGNFGLLKYLIRTGRAWMKRNGYKKEEYELFFAHIGATTKQQQQSKYSALLHALGQGKLATLNMNCSLELWLEKKLQQR